MGATTLRFIEALERRGRSTSYGQLLLDMHARMQLDCGR